MRHPGSGVDLDSANTLSTTDLLSWSFATFYPRLAVACSFQAESSVLIDLIYRERGADFRVFTLDTGRLWQETYDCLEAMRARYGIDIHVFFPEAARVEAMVEQNGVNLFYESVEKRKLCCSVRKVEPLKRALRGLDCWITGQRREQAVTRTQLRKVEIDHENGGIVKLNPLADWSGRRVWDYIRRHKLPYNKLHDRGYPSIGCAPCTRAIHAIEDSRAGRWWWENPETRECGLHAKSA